MVAGQEFIKMETLEKVIIKQGGVGSGGGGLLAGVSL